MAVNPFAPKSTTSNSFTTSQSFPFPVPSPTPSPSSYAPTTTVTVTATDSNLPAGSTIQPTDTITDSSGSKRNTISVTVMTFGVIIGLIVVGGCVTLMFTQRKFSKKKIKKKRMSNVEQGNVFLSEEDDEHPSKKSYTRRDKINFISPPLNLPPHPPQRLPSQRPPTQRSPPQNPPPSLSQRPLPQLPPSPSESPPLLLHRSSESRYSLESEYDPVYTDPNHYQRSLRTTSSSGRNNAIDMPASIHIEEPP